MHNALNLFKANIKGAQEQGQLYNFLAGSFSSPFSFEDILRFQLVYSVSAFDKLIHDVIRIGMVATYMGTRLPTPSFLTETLSIELHRALATATIPPAEAIFEQEITKKLRTMAFQDPDKISKGLSLVWSEQHKWQIISNKMNISCNDAVTTLKLICSRRNAIIHEADIDPITNTRTPISQAEANNVSNFLEKCGIAIVSLVA